MSKTAFDQVLSHWDGNIPVDVEGIARSLGIHVKPRFGMPRGESGCITRSEDDEYVIEYDATQARVRQRFTVAHEIGHYALGHLARGQREFRDMPAHFSSGIDHPKERDANSFAAQLLMPKEAVKYAIADDGVNSLTALANYFNVSRAAMTYRLRSLGIPIEEYSLQEA